METIHQIYPLNSNKTFSEDEAYELVNLLSAVTSPSKNKINAYNSQLELFKGQNDKADKAQFELNNQISKWSEKVRRLGGIPLALYKVKIPASSGYYVWEFPSVELEFIPQ